MKVLTSLIVSALVFGAAQVAQADGFVCTGDTTGTQFKIYNKVRVSEGNRNASVMIVSDPKVSMGRKTIATFTDFKNTLENKGTRYTAHVDLRVLESNRSGENIAGTKLGELSTINVVVYFNYHTDTPSYLGEEFEGQVDYLKRNGQRITEALSCLRYIKKK